MKTTIYGLRVLSRLSLLLGAVALATGSRLVASEPVAAPVGFYDTYFVNDYLATTVASIDAAGVIAQIETDAFGAPLAAGQPAVRYTGKPYDEDMGAYVFPFRNYRPDEARWMTQDPSGFPDGPNGNAYACQLFIQVDKLGLWGTDVHKEIIIDWLGGSSSDNYFNYEWHGTTYNVISILQRASRRADNIFHQGSGQAYRHGMRATGQTVLEAQNKWQGYINDNINEAISDSDSARSLGDYKDQVFSGNHTSYSLEYWAIMELGYSVHAYVDAFSPVHRDQSLSESQYTTTGTPIEWSLLDWSSHDSTKENLSAYLDSDYVVSIRNGLNGDFKSALDHILSTE